MNQAEELKMDKNLDLFEYITNLDIGNGSGNQQAKQNPQEEQKKPPEFDFNNFAAGNDGSSNNQAQAK